jgi:hypothetical protein
MTFTDSLRHFHTTDPSRFLTEGRANRPDDGNTLVLDGLFNRLPDFNGGRENTHKLEREKNYGAH